MGRLPVWAKGELRECVICGFWFPERDPRILKQEGKWVCKWDYDSLTDLERSRQIAKSIQRLER